MSQNQITDLANSVNGGTDNCSINVTTLGRDLRSMQSEPDRYQVTADEEGSRSNKRNKNKKKKIKRTSIDLHNFSGFSDQNFSGFRDLKNFDGFNNSEDFSDYEGFNSTHDFSGFSDINNFSGFSNPNN